MSLTFLTGNKIVNENKICWRRQNLFMETKIVEGKKKLSTETKFDHGEKFVDAKFVNVKFVNRNKIS